MHNINYYMKRFKIIAGPCVVESKELLEEVSETLLSICSKFDVDFIFKSSYKKANRTSAGSFTGIGDDLALSYLTEIRKKYNIPVLTDVHTDSEAEKAAGFVDILQIPAFLCRQTDLLIAAGKTGKTVNIKKGQFLAPDDMAKAAAKVESTGNKDIWLTERGTCFGYHDLVVDFRSILIMQKTGYPVIYDATHSLQQPSVGIESGGYPEFIPALAYAAVAAGADGIFFETHPNPSKAKSDSATQLPLSTTKKFIENIIRINRLING